MEQDNSKPLEATALTTQEQTFTTPEQLEAHLTENDSFFLPANKAQGTAAASFRITIQRLLTSTITSGRNQFEVDVTAVNEGIVANVTKELEGLGYQIHLNNHYVMHKQDGGKTKVLKVKF